MQNARNRAKVERLRFCHPSHPHTISLFGTFHHLCESAAHRKPPLGMYTARQCALSNAEHFFFFTYTSRPQAFAPSRRITKGTGADRRSAKWSGVLNSLLRLKWYGDLWVRKHCIYTTHVNLTTHSRTRNEKKRSILLKLSISLHALMMTRFEHAVHISVPLRCPKDCRDEAKECASELKKKKRKYRRSHTSSVTNERPIRSQ